MNDSQRGADRVPPHKLEINVTGFDDVRFHFTINGKRYLVSERRDGSLIVREVSGQPPHDPKGAA